VEGVKVGERKAERGSGTAKGRVSRLSSDSESEEARERLEGEGEWESICLMVRFHNASKCVG
jgi:hypothetical protein